MSQSGLLNEDEIKNYIEENFGLKLNRDQLIKPTADLVTDIYARFLDFTDANWRKIVSEENTERAIMVSRIKYILSRYNTQFEFRRQDLLLPTRKRTTAFMNVLIYDKAQFDNNLAIWEDWSAECMASKEMIENYHQHIAESKLHLENLALKKATSKPPDEMIQENKRIQSMFDAAKVKSDSKGAEAKEIKDELKQETKVLERYQVSVDIIKKEVDQLERERNMLNDGRSTTSRIPALQELRDNLIDRIRTKSKAHLDLKSKIADNHKFRDTHAPTKNNISELMNYHQQLRLKLKQEIKTRETRLERAETEQTRLRDDIKSPLQDQLSELKSTMTKETMESKIKEEKLRHLTEREIGVKNELLHMSASQVEQHQAWLAAREKERAELLTARKASDAKRDLYEEKANQQIKMLIEHYEASEKVSQKGVPAIRSYISKLDSLMGQQKEVEAPANRTYIKESCPHITSE